MNGHNRIGRHQLKAGLDQQLLGEGIANLHGRALGLGIFFKVSRRHRRAMDAITPGFRPDIDNRIADACRGRVENFIRIRDANCHRIDEDIAIIGGVEIGLTAHGRHAHAIAIAANSGNHAFDQMLHLGMIRPTKPQSVRIRDRARAHSEHIAQNPANARCCTLIGFDVGGVVVALHLENGSQFLPVRPVTNVDHTGILARAANHPVGLGWELL